MPEFRVKIAINGFVMFYCGSLVRSCWTELKYDRILAVGGRGFELWVLKVQENRISSIFSPTSWQVWTCHYMNLGWFSVLDDWRHQSSHQLLLVTTPNACTHTTEISTTDFTSETTNTTTDTKEKTNTMAKAMAVSEEIPACVVPWINMFVSPVMVAWIVTGLTATKYGSAN